MRRLTGHTKEVRSLAYTPSGQLISGGGDRTVRVWEPVSGECLHAVKAGRVVYAVAVSPDGRWFASAGRDRRQEGRILWNFIQIHAADGIPAKSLTWAGERPRSVWSRW